MSAPRSASTIILLLAFVGMTGSLATQLVVPALPLMAKDLNSSIHSAQLVVGVYLAGLGVGQLIAGPLSDRIGRKQVMLAGLLLFILGCLLAAVTDDINVMLAARLLQALGAAAGVVTSRVLVGDYFPQNEIAARQATVMAVVLISPAIAPVIGGFITEYAGWRAIFGGLVLCAVINAVLSVPLLPALPPRDRATQARLLGAYASLLRNRKFLCHAGTIAAGSATLYAFLTAAPFLLQNDLGLGPRDSGLCLLLVAIASMAGTRLVKGLDSGGGGPMTGAVVTLCGAILILLLALFGMASLWPLLAASAVIGVGAGVAGPSNIARIIQASPGIEGTAASLAGATQMLASAVAAATIGHAATRGFLELGLGLTFCAAMSLLLAWMAKRS